MGQKSNDAAMKDVQVKLGEEERVLGTVEKDYAELRDVQNKFTVEECATGMEQRYYTDEGCINKFRKELKSTLAAVTRRINNILLLLVDNGGSHKQLTTYEAEPCKYQICCRKARRTTSSFVEFPLTVVRETQFRHGGAKVHRGNETYQSIFQKTRSILSYVATHYLDDYDYFGGDDIMHVIVENMKKSHARIRERRLHSGNKEGRIFGQLEIKPHAGNVIFTGGPGYTLDCIGLKKVARFHAQMQKNQEKTRRLLDVRNLNL
eukprot:scaffold9129_cov78-Skeletonema_dohrnii-CCMP3373.AAC.4